MNLTEQQQAALSTTGVSVALSAGAGCGKTFVLTQRFLRAIDTGSGADVLPRIVAITFTERAAREMRDRIRKACDSRLQDAGDDEQEHWLAILRAIDTARISTIHAFCAALLRTFAVEAELDPQFTVLEDADSRTLLRRSVTAGLHDLLSQHDDDCMQFVYDYGLERCASLMIDLAGGRFHAGDASEPTTADDRFADWQARWERDFVPLLLNKVSESSAAAHLLALLESHSPDNATMRERCETLRRDLPSLSNADDPIAALDACRTCATVQRGGGKSAWEDEEIYNEIRDTLTALRKEIDKALEALKIPHDDRRLAAEGSVRAERIARHILDGYRQRKAELGVLDFDDLLLKTRDLLRDNPAVRNAAAAGIDFLMVDEFQDTDPVQSRIVRDLCGNELLSGKLFLVGDIKQSIYRFRRADPRVFTALRGELPAEGQLPLSVNFRSQPAILDFVNCLFAPAMGEDYELLVPHVEQQSPTPAIEFLFSRPGDDDGDRESAEARRTREAEWMAARLRQLLDDPTPRIREADAASGETDLRPVRPGDVAILFRALSNVHLYEDALRSRGIEYYLVGGRAFFAQQEVYDLMNLLSYLDEPDDGVALAGILRSPMFGLSDDTLLALVEDKRPLTEAIQAPPCNIGDADQAALVAFASTLLAELRANKDRQPLSDLLEAFIERTGYDAILLTEFLGRRQLANLQKLIESARAFDRAGLLTVSEFVERLKESVAEQSHEELAATHPESSNVVRLMTIHQSKGLEFPVTIIADMDWSRNQSGGVRFHEHLGPLLPLPPSRDGSKKNIGQVMHRLEEEAEDERETQRLLYVATTRAADYLILSAGVRHDFRVTSPWLKLIAERFDLQTGDPARDPYLGKLSLEGVPPERIPTIFVHHERPEPGESPTKRPRQLPLSKVRETLAATEPGVLPATLNPIPAAAPTQIEVSVTNLLQADRELRQMESFARLDDFDREPDLFAPIDDEDDAPDARTLGTLIHVALERLNESNCDDIAAHVDRAATFLKMKPDDTMRETAVARVTAFRQSPVFEEIAAATTCYRELDFVYQLRDAGPRVLVSGQIDCLYQSAGGGWTLLDFKTGDPHDDLLDRYLVQLAVYAAASERALGCSIDRVGLVQVHDTIELLLLPPATFSDAATQSRVEAAVERQVSPR